MNFKPMDQSLVQTLLEGHEDILTKAAAQEEIIFRQASCPNCGLQGIQKRVDPPRLVAGPSGEPEIMSTPFGSGPLVRAYGYCPSCGTEFDPHTGIIRRLATMTPEPHSDPR